MLDAILRPKIDPSLDKIAQRLVSFGLTANHITAAGFICGAISMAMILMHQLPFAALFVILNRLLDGLDGAIARRTVLTDFGGFLDIVADFVVYAGLVFAFGIANPEVTSYALFLVFSFVGPIVSFLAFAIMASKNGLETQARGQKSFYYMGGICEGTETAAVLVLMCLAPQYFASIAMIFGCLCWLTTLGRILHAKSMLKNA